MTPTREQVIEWAKAAGLNRTRTVERFAALAYSAGMAKGLERAKEACEQKAARYDLAGENTDDVTAHWRATAARSCAAAIEQLKGKP